MNPVPRLFSESKQIIMTDKEIKIMNLVNKTDAQKERSVLKRNLLFGLIGLIVIIVLAVPILNQAATATETEANVQGAFAADAGRYQAMADFNRVDNRSEALRYQALADLYTNVQRAFEADAARYTAMADFYLSKNGAEAARYQGLADLYTNTQRAIKADAARYTALANFYRAKNGVEAARYQGLADLYANTQRAIEADAARYTALAAFYLNKNEVKTSREQWLAGLHLPRSETALSAFLADNPDLMMAHRYPATEREIVEAKPYVMNDLFLAKNGVEKLEVAEVETSRDQWLAGLHLPRSETALSAFLADNPDLMVAGRYLVKTNTDLPTNNKAWDRWFYPGH
jgi:hypothetical protein